MKFIHTADWHLGKLVHGIYMTSDQEYILKQFLDLIDLEQPDAVIIAGDLYDRSIPPTEAVELLNRTLYEINVTRGIPVVSISGNHDSAERLSFGSSWYRQSHFYMESIISKIVHPITIKGVNFYAVPYAEPGVIREVFGEPAIHSHQDGMKAIIDQIKEQLNPNEVNVFVGHAFVLGGDTTDSERVLSVGGSGCVTQDLFEPFHYTALGHLHSPDAIKHPKIRYSGSLLKYSFSEVTQRKSVTIVDMNELGDFTNREVTFKPLRDMREITGYLDEIIDSAFYQNQKVNDYLKITLLDEGALIDPMNKLRQVYPNVLHLERKIDLIDLKRKVSGGFDRTEKKTELELFKQFYEEMTALPFSDEKREIMVEVIEKAMKGGRDE
jgi:exonuclease SbcD